MKKVFFTAILLVSAVSFSFANKGSEQEMQLMRKISSMVQVDKIISALGLKGEANVWITITEDKTIQVQSVESENFITTFYLKQSLNGKQVEVSDDMIGKTIPVEINFVQSN